MKVAPIHSRMVDQGMIEPLLVHTGQHYDEKMSRVFFDDLEMPQPAVYLGVGSGTHSEQTARVMVGFEEICRVFNPDLILVVGDVNSTLACSIVAAKHCVPVAHVEAGLRSRDRSMPEEINRLLTDQVSDLLFIHSPEAEENLVQEGISREKIHLVGNVMIDALMMHLPKARLIYRKELESEFPVREFGLVTLHRPSNVDDAATLNSFIRMLDELSRRLPLLFPVHPRTRSKINELCVHVNGRLQFTEPLGYLSFLGLLEKARLVVTDSGGIQEETSFLGVPCVTARDNTERPITAELGTNILAGKEPEKVLVASLKQLESPKKGTPIPLWDGKAAERIVQIILDRYKQ